MLACPRCGGRLCLIATLEDPAVVSKILAHLRQAASEPAQPARPKTKTVTREIQRDANGRITKVVKRAGRALRGRLDDLPRGTQSRLERPLHPANPG